MNELTIQEPLSIGELLAHVNTVQQVMKQVMRDGEHYGKVPGCGDKPTLLQPGAQKLMLAFRMSPQYVVDVIDLPREHREYRVVCNLLNANGVFIGSGNGSASTMESKYRYRKGELVCPECGKSAIIKGKAEFGGGWICYGKKGGCGKKWSDADSPFEGMSTDRVEHDNPADYWNTALKIACKRALVSGVLTRTGASDIYTQDVEEIAENLRAAQREEAPRAEQKARATAAKPKMSKQATDTTRQWMLDEFAKLNLDARNATEYAVAMKLIQSGGNIHDWPLSDVPTSKEALSSLVEAIVQHIDDKDDQLPGEPSPQSKLEAIVIGSGFKFDRFKQWAVGTGQFTDKEAEDVNSFDEVPKAKAELFLAAKNSMLKSMKVKP